jgi:hypothetical protein
VAGQAVPELEEAAQERLLRRRAPLHVGSTLAATQHSAQRDEQQFVQVMQTGMPVRGSFSPSKQATNWSKAASVMGTP